MGESTVDLTWHFLPVTFVPHIYLYRVLSQVQCVVHVLHIFA